MNKAKFLYKSVKSYDYDHEMAVNAYGYPMGPTNMEDIRLSGAMTEQEKIDISR